MSSSTSQAKLVKKLEKETDPDHLDIDQAFLDACKNCGIDPAELKARSVESFREEGLADEIVQRRFNNFQFARVRKLHMVAMHRKKLLAGEGSVARTPRPPPPRTLNGNADTSADAADEPTPSKEDGKTEQDLMVQRAWRQRKMWDRVNLRLQRARQIREIKDSENQEKAHTYAELDGKQRHDMEREREERRKMVQEAMHRRWKRDEAMAQARQERIDAEFKERMEQFKLEMMEHELATERRVDVLRERAHEGAAETIIQRLNNAKEKHEEAAATKRKVAEDRLSKAEERRAKNAIDRFLRQVKLANRAVKERAHAQEVVETARSRSTGRIQEIEKSDEENSKRMDQRMAGIREQSKDQREALAKRRQERHIAVRKNRQLKRDQAEKQFHETVERRELKEQARQKQLALEAALRKEDSTAKTQYHEEVLQRVRRRTEADQEARQKRLHEREEVAEQRMSELESIRSILR